MNLANDAELANTGRKLTLLEQQIEWAKARPRSPENDQSVRSLLQMAEQLREEITRYGERKNRLAPQLRN